MPIGLAAAGQAGPLRSCQREFLLLAHVRTKNFSSQRCSSVRLKVGDGGAGGGKAEPGARCQTRSSSDGVLQCLGFVYEGSEAFSPCVVLK